MHPLRPERPIKEAKSGMKLEINLRKSEEKKERPAHGDELSFGDIFTDHMFIMDYREGQGWIDPRIVPYGDLRIDPGAMGLHYGQAFFEGLKCYRRADGGLQLFRPRDNFARLNASAERLCMPQVDVEEMLDHLKQLVRVEDEWVPSIHGSSLYVRPTMFATEPHLGVRPAREYILFMIVTPVGAYYTEGFKPIKIYVQDKYVRAVRGGVGNIKAAGNYAASLYAAEEAKKKGFTQILWLDAVELKYIEEVGTSNMFFVINGELVTPPLSGSILPGVTRATVLDLARAWGGYKISERPITIDEVIASAKDGSLTEAFGTGTAVVISPVSHIVFKDEEHQVADGRTGPLSQRLFDYIMDVQYGRLPDEFGWIEPII